MIRRNTPELFVRDVEESIRFYTETLGFDLEGRMPEDHSKPVEWAMVVNGNASFMFQKPDRPKEADGVVFYLGGRRHGRRDRGPESARCQRGRTR
jgi:catechol 2,3-dioxygenase-like lactoylglutathione lyase family enzyme